ncbi:hypothetical protein NDU88_005439 [Pleurodeles waltl]|uniref:Uncharacterized protein n=1 Tax=Pleurodeles waltl TaxID=8319 RepID=A0AAV7VJ00_PLEWA|nr:hypothetical protein NDU88_005439 [Pleurodeles waltl]
MGGILSRSLPGPLHLQGLVLQQRVPLRVFLHLSALSPLPAPAMGQPEPRLGEGPREGRNRATGSLPCCSCGGRGGCVTSRHPPIPLPSRLASSSPSRGSTRLPAGSDLPRGPNTCSPPEGTAGGRGPSHVGGPYVFFLPRRYSSDLRAGWADGGESRPLRPRPRHSTQGPRLSPGASSPVRGPAGPSATGICGWGTVQAPPGPHAASPVCRNLSPAGRFLLRPPSLFPLP